MKLVFKLTQAELTLKQVLNENTTSPFAIEEMNARKELSIMAKEENLN